MNVASESEQSFLKIVGMDPGTDWLLGPGWPGFRSRDEDSIIPFIMTSTDEALLKSLYNITHAEGDIWPSVIILGDRQLKTGIPFAGLTTSTFLRKQLEDQTSPRFRQSAKCIQLGLPLCSSALTSIPGRPKSKLGKPAIYPDAGFPPETVVVGIIDDGIAFAHERFRRSDGTTRFAYFWHQDGRPASWPTVSLGREYGKKEIDALLGQAKHLGGVDEEKLYCLAGVADFAQLGRNTISWRLSHGTHVLDVAAGYDMKCNRTDRPIIGVQLPVACTASQSGAGLEPFVLCAIQYILHRAALLSVKAGRRLPVVINYSYSTYAGPHDGTSLLERAIDIMMAQTHPKNRRRMVLPAGNSNNARCHAQVDFTDPTQPCVQLLVRVQPDNQATTTLQLWLPPSAGNDPPKCSRVKLKIVGPDGIESDWIEEAPFQCATTPPHPLPITENSSVYCLLNYAFDPCSTRGVFRIDIQSTTRVLPKLPGTDPKLLAPAGLWTIVLENVSLGKNDTIEAWIERSERPHGYPRYGRQSYFDDPAHVRFDPQGRPIAEDSPNPSSPVRRLGMLNAIGTGREPVVIGGFVRKDLTIAEYSAGGPALHAVGQPPGPQVYKPDATTVSDDSRVHTGVIAAGSKSGSSVAMRGTSVAAPQVTRHLANQLAAGLPANRASIIQEAKDSEVQLPISAPPLVPHRGGAGRIEYPQRPRTPPRFVR